MTFVAHDTVTVHFRDTTRPTEMYDDVQNYHASDGMLVISTDDREIGINLTIIERYQATGGSYS